jgi:hypothetical protein
MHDRSQKAIGQNGIRTADRGAGYMLREHKEFYQIDLTSGWEQVPGYPAGIDQKILSGHLDEPNGTGMRTRLLRFQPGVATTVPFEHEYWEEVFQLTGSLTVGGETFGPMTYAVRPPGVSHGPFRSDEGCILLESHYFDPLYGA